MEGPPAIHSDFRLTVSRLDADALEKTAVGFPFGFGAGNATDADHGLFAALGQVLDYVHRFAARQAAPMKD